MSAVVETHEVYLRIVADFEVIIDGCVIYAEQLFTVVEFAIASQAWVRGPRSSERDFIFTSMESEDEGLVWIKNHNGEWRLGSAIECTSAGPRQLLDVTGALMPSIVVCEPTSRMRFRRTSKVCLRGKRHRRSETP
jgi:hypothetical protein